MTTVTSMRIVSGQYCCQLMLIIDARRSRRSLSAATVSRPEAQT